MNKKVHTEKKTTSCLEREGENEKKAAVSGGFLFFVFVNCAVLYFTASFETDRAAVNESRLFCHLWGADTGAG